MVPATMLLIALAPVQYEGNAMPLSKHLERLSEEVGEVWTAAPELRDLTFVVRSSKLDPGALRRAIAESAAAKWSQDGPRWILRPDPVRRSEVERARLERDAKRIREWQAVLARLYAAPFDSTMAKDLARRLRDMDAKMVGKAIGDSYTEYSKLEPLMPLKRSLARIVAKLDPYVLAGAKSLTVFDTRPNRLQRPLPRGADREVAAAVAAHNEWIKAWPAVPVVTTRYSTDPRFHVEPLRVQDVRLRLRISVSRTGGFGSISAFLVDSRGRVAQTATLFMGEGEEFSPPAPAKPPEPRNFPVPNDIVSVAEHFRADFRGQAPEELKARLRQPEAEDPLALAMGPVLHAASKHFGWDLVACVPELGVIAVSAVKPQTDWELMRLLLGASADVVERPGLVLVKPLTFEPPAPRSWLKQAVAELERHGSISLDTAITLAESLPEASYHPVVSRVFALLVPGADRYSNAGLLWDVGVLRKLPTATRQTLAAGRQVMFDTLPPTARVAVEAMILRAEPFEFHTRRVASDPSAAIRFELDATDLLADREHGPVSLRLYRSQAPHVLAQVEPQWQTLSAESLGYAIWQFERGTSGQDGHFGNVSAGQYRMADWEQRSLRIEFGSSASFTRSWSWVRADGRQAPVRYGDLPEEFRVQVQKQVERLRKAESPPP